MNSNNSSSTYPDIDQSKLPAHIAIIMDGNGRWAKKRLLNRISGHQKGADTVRTIVRTSRELGISVLTLYAFSTENWQRPKVEVAAIMSLLQQFLKKEEKELLNNNIRLNAIGQTERLPQEVQKALEKTLTVTEKNNGMLLNLALSYGGRSEIIRMVKKIAEKSKSCEINPDSITSELVSNNLYTAGIPDPDILIRTSGEMRISNFLLWQIAYSEIFITDTLWPDFGKKEFLSIIKAYQKRDRRFGKV